ncbi:type IV pilus assembly protein PilV [Pseudoduganella namucuonensis]|uniref:Type IV pilus assembly protein PilV n=2 Tax=Pseudoduganella namucuonensis TaxID=1035707 RepID=A0A1I7HSD1_9BURK|nr:type IV pilus assembly protein PilV [Pseudoduganella namucuonensis]
MNTPPRIPCRPPAPRRQRGVALLEAIIAIVILGIGLMGTVGMQARAYSALSDAGARAEATIAGERLLGMMSNDTANLASYAVAENGTPTAQLSPWLAETRVAIPNAIVSVVVTPQVGRSRVDISMRWTRKAGGAENRHVLTSYVADAS